MYEPHHASIGDYRPGISVAKISDITKKDAIGLRYVCAVGAKQRLKQAGFWTMTLVIRRLFESSHAKSESIRLRTDEGAKRSTK